MCELARLLYPRKNPLLFLESRKKLIFLDLKCVSPIDLFYFTVSTHVDEKETDTELDEKVKFLT